MNNYVKTIYKPLALIACLSAATQTYADMNKIMSLINDPSQAPVVKRCEGNAKCNAFVAISSEWQIIPKDDPLRYPIYTLDDIDLIGFGKNLNVPVLKDIDEFAFHIFHSSADNRNDTWLYIKGLCVLKYIQRVQFSSQ